MCSHDDCELMTAKITEDAENDLSSQCGEGGASVSGDKLILEEGFTNLT